MEETRGDLACVYCGGRHDGADEVRACWKRSAQPDSAVSQHTSAFDGNRAPSGPILGRSVVVEPGQTPPVEWARCERAGGGIDELESAWRERTPLVIEVAEESRDDEIDERPVWSLSPLFAFPGERRAHATFSNAVDARGTASRWRWTEKAVSLGARAEGPADVLLTDGRPAYCDGGPLHWQDTVNGAAVIPRLALLADSLLPFGANDCAAILAPDQLAAVTYTGGTARIIAPAGSGKTRVLTERAGHSNGSLGITASDSTAPLRLYVADGVEQFWMNQEAA